MLCTIAQDKDNALPDLLSRCTGPRPVTTGMVQTSDDVYAVGQLDELDFISAIALTEATVKDDILTQVIKHVQAGWPTRVAGDSAIKPFHQVRDELTVCDAGYLVRGERAVIPSALWNQVLKFIHAGHQGIVKSKQRSRSTVWWPNVDKDIENMCKQCETCLLTKTHSIEPPLEPIQLPEQPWVKVSIDISGPFQVAPQNYLYLLVVVDMLSGWPEVQGASQVTTETVIRFLDKLAATWGYPKELLSDNGSQFTSAEFQDYCTRRDIKHLLAAVYTPTTNGKVERLNREIKQALKRAHHEGEHIPDAIPRFLFQYRSTPHTLTEASPAMLMIGRELRGSLTSLTSAKTGVTSVVDKARRCAAKKQQAYTQYHDRRYRVKDIRLQIGDCVRKKKAFQNHKLEVSWSTDSFVVTRIVKPYTYELNDCSIWNIRKLQKVNY
jgi:transposase InsO family protein